MSDVIDWSKPISVRRRPTISIMSGAGASDGRGGYHWDEVRAEQLRRASLLLDASGAPKLTPGKAATRVAALAAVVPGLRYAAGALIYSGLAPQLSLVPSLFDASAKSGGRPVKWTPEMRAKLADDLSALRLRKPHLTDTLPALKALRSEWIRDIKDRLRAEGKPIDGDEYKSLEPPSPVTLRNVLGVKT